MSLYTIDYSKLKKNYFKKTLPVALILNLEKFLLLNLKITKFSNKKFNAELSNLNNFKEFEVTIYGKKLKSLITGGKSKFKKYIQNMGSKLGVLEITSKKGLSGSEAGSVYNLDSWAASKDFTIKASQYKKKYGNEINYSGKTTFLGSSAGEKVFGGDGKDKLYGEKGKDKLYGENGNDIIYGGNDSDKILGGLGNDKIYGGSGNDYLVGGKGNDKLIGGKGKDIFKLSKGKGFDLIQDFKNKQDKIFIGSMKKLKLKNKGKDVFIYESQDLLAKVKKAKGLLSTKGKFLV